MLARWSIEGVVGSQPWSNVRISRSPSRSASRMSGSRRSKSCRQRWKLTRSFRWPPGWSVSTRLTKTRPESTFSSSSIVRLMPSTFDFVGNDSSISQPAKDVGDLPDAVHRVTGIANRGQVVRAPRLGRSRAGSASFVVARLADERAGDDAADRMLSRQDLPGDPAPRRALPGGSRLLVRRDLEDRVGGRVDDPRHCADAPPRAPGDGLGTRRQLVADHAAAGAVHEQVDHLVGKAVGYVGKRSA